MSTLQFFAQQIDRVIGYLAEHEIHTWLQSFSVQLEMRFTPLFAAHGAVQVRIEFLYFPHSNGKVSFVPRFIDVVHEVDGDSANERRDRSKAVEERLRGLGALPHDDGEGAEVANSWYHAVHKLLGNGRLGSESLRWSYFGQGNEHPIPVS